MRLKGQVTEKGVLTRTRAAFLRYTHLPVCCTLCLGFIRRQPGLLALYGWIRLCPDTEVGSV